MIFLEQFTEEKVANKILKLRDKKNLHIYTYIVMHTSNKKNISYLWLKTIKSH